MPNKNRKRLCVLMPGHWSRIMGGSQYQAKCLIDAVAKTGFYDIFFLTRDCLANFSANGYQLVRYDFPGARRRGVHRILFEMVALPRALKRIGPDIIYQRVGCGQTGIAARYAVKHGCKMVWHIASEHDVSSPAVDISRLFIYRLLDRQLLNFGIRHATDIIAQTEDQKRMLEENFKRTTTAVVPNFHPVPTEAIVKQFPVKIVWVANLKDLKQPEVFIHLATELQALPKAQFIMIGALQGTDRLRRKYLQLMERAPNLKYIGPQTQEEVNNILAQSHILVNTSRHEGFPNTFIQAWLRQMPAVSLQVNPDRLIEKQNLGFVSGSFEQLKRDVSALITNEELRNQLGRNAQYFALRHFSIGNTARIVQVFETPLSQRG